jgi:hypothetical protein
MLKMCKEKKEIESSFDFVRMICILDFFRLLLNFEAAVELFASHYASQSPESARRISAAGMNGSAMAWSHRTLTSKALITT